MYKDQLFLLAPGFSEGDERQYCPECAEMWGILSYYPAIKDSVDVIYQSITRPRSVLVSLLGEHNQNCPTLVLNELSPDYEDCGIKVINGTRFIDNARDIGRYYAMRFGTPVPRT